MPPRLVSPTLLTQRLCVRRCRSSLRAARTSLTALCPLAQHLAQYPGLAETIETTSLDLVAADLLAAARAFLDELDDLDLT